MGIKDYDQLQQEEQDYYNELDKRDPIQEELDRESQKLMGEFGTHVKSKTPLSPAAQEILEHFVAVHTKLSEKKRAYNLASWVLRKGKV